LKRDETRVGSAEKEKEELVEELSTLRQSLDETRDKLEKSNISRKLLEERLKESETAAKVYKIFIFFPFITTVYKSQYY